jgi:hypothetical protein
MIHHFLGVHPILADERFWHSIYRNLHFSDTLKPRYYRCTSGLSWQGTIENYTFLTNARSPDGETRRLSEITVESVFSRRNRNKRDIYSDLVCGF